VALPDETDTWLGACHGATGAFPRSHVIDTKEHSAEEIEQMIASFGASEVAPVPLAQVGQRCLPAPNTQETLTLKT
jgi:hypothetical protein